MIISRLLAALLPFVRKFGPLIIQFILTNIPSITSYVKSFWEKASPSLKEVVILIAIFVVVGIIASIILLIGMYFSVWILGLL